MIIIIMTVIAIIKFQLIIGLVSQPEDLVNDNSKLYLTEGELFIKHYFGNEIYLSSRLIERRRTSRETIFFVGHDILISATTKKHQSRKFVHLIFENYLIFIIHATLKKKKKQLKVYRFYIHSHASVFHSRSAINLHDQTVMTLSV